MEIEICIIPENETEIELLKKLELEKVVDRKVAPISRYSCGDEMTNEEAHAKDLFSYWNILILLLPLGW